ncbi:MAG TPA: hypothetical protein VFO70_05655, partial [Chitinophagaceae bacterium]|nr:hypothetical protein [Chitinophagaceae bacterium]
YPALDCKYTAKNGGIYITRYLIQGPHYYTLIAYGKKETPVMQQFLDSFEIVPYQYGEAKAGTDTSLYFKFESPVFPETKKQKLEFPRFSYLGVEEDIDEKDQLEEGIYRTRIISNDTTGEKIYVAFYKSSRYFYRKDSTGMDSDDEVSVMGDTSWIVKSNKISRLSNGMKVRDIVVTDTGSSRSIRTKKFVRNGIGFILMTQQDTLGKSSAFVRSFFDSFSPADTLNGVDLFQKKSDLFFRDFMSSDSMVHKMAVRNIKDIYLDSTDWPGLKKAINSLTFKEKRYLSVKKMLLAKLGRIKTREASNYMRDTYYAAGDTIELQYTALETLLRQRTDYAYSVFRDIIVSEPPVLEKNTERNFSYSNILREDAFARRFQGYDGSFLDELHDSLLLTRTILPDLLPLLNLDDYKGAMMNLLARMIDSNLVKPGDYELYFNKLLLEAKQEMKKQAIAERKKAIERAEENKVARKSSTPVVEYVSDGGNDDLSLYSRLLLPYWDKQKAVQGLFQQMLRSNDRQLKYNSLIALMRNNKPHPDSLLDYFAMLDEYRYDLYRDLKKMGRSAKFPVKYNNHLDLGKSMLLTSKEYGKPDTLVYIDKMRADLKNKKGFIYFYKYKSKKEDMTWKLATVGLVPEDPKQFEFAEGKEKASENQLFMDLAQARRLNYTNLSDTKINDDEPLAEQLR